MASPKVKCGDIIGFSGFNWQSAVINAATYGIPFWDIAHVGIIGMYQGEKLLFESTTLTDLPCVIQGKPFKGTQAVRLQNRLATYKGAVWHYPLFRPLHDNQGQRLNQFLLDHIGIPYDYIGAIRAGGIGWSWFESLLYEQDLSFIFCSEWCAAAHTHIGLLRTSNVSRWNPNRLIRYERRQGTLLRPWRLIYEEASSTCPAAASGGVQPVCNNRLRR